MLDLKVESFIAEDPKTITRFNVRPLCLTVFMFLTALIVAGSDQWSLSVFFVSVTAIH